MKVCDLLFDGLQVRAGLLVGTVIAVCDQPPQRHLLRAGLELRVGDEWIEIGRSRVADVIPDAAGFPVEVNAPCEEGTWRAWARAEGVGPAPPATPFSFSATGAERAVTLVECAA
ncbi:hypothetical protein BU204_35985 [Actinophytocola xanthii]|uniref:Uncharacterized protein n=2 Tax=Actinophytocola xanthii TaxID=1912961 RepID=A0A1Q8BXT3_9PSEU|nr:hypothetical protein BU204_35985 [Actinophytocola xanthii]